MEDGADRARPSRRRALVAVALCAAAYLYVFPYYPRINNPNENVRLYMTAALVEQHTYRIDAERRRWGWVNDAAVKDGHYYSVKAPGTSLLGVPGYAVYYWLAGNRFDRTTALWVVRVTATVLPMLVFLFFFYRWLGERTRHPLIRDSVFFSVALGSLLFGYTYMFASHTTSAAVAFGAFIILYQARHRGEIASWAAFWAGLLAAGATLFEYPCFIVSLILCLYALTALRPWRRLVPFVGGALIPTLAMMHFQWSAFDNPFTPGHHYVENPYFRHRHEEGFYGAQFFHPDAARALMLDFRLGLLSLTPILVFAVPGFVVLLRKKSERVDGLVALVTFSTLYIAICFMNNWPGGWSLGPRYLAVLVPFVAWAAAVGLDAAADLAPRLTGGIALGCMVAAMIASGIPSMYYPHLPPGLDWPLAHLFSILIEHDYAPRNAGNLLGWYGSASMVPILLLFVFIAGWAARSWARSRDRASVLAVAGLTAALLMLPHFRAPPPAPAAVGDVAFITRTWSPRGHDRASRLQDTLQASTDPSPAGYRRLADLYLQEGRRREAEAAIRRAEHPPPAHVR